MSAVTSPPEVSRISQARVLILEDDQAILQMLRDMLGMQEIDSIGVDRPEPVLDLAREYHPRLFVIDVMLAGKSGIEVAQELRNRGFADTPMIALSASRWMIDAAVDSGLFQVVLLKPFDHDELLCHIRRLLNEPVPGKSLS